MSISVENIRECEICGRTYNHDRLATCPSCKGDRDYLEKKSNPAPQTAINFVRPCETCGREYNHVQLSECPACSVTPGSGIKEMKTDAKRKAHMELINAQAKTTHAVRAVVHVLRFFLWTAFIIFIYYFLVGLNQDDLIWLLALDVILWFAGAVYTLYKVDLEMHKSE